MVPAPLQVKAHTFAQYIFSAQGERTKADNNPPPLNSPMTFDPGIIETFFFSMAQQPVEGQGLLIIEASRSHSNRHTTLGRTPLDE
jgi:hypothetical protein